MPVDHPRHFHHRFQARMRRPEVPLFSNAATPSLGADSPTTRAATPSSPMPGRSSSSTYATQQTALATIPAGSPPSCTFPENPQVNRRPLTKSRHLTCVAGNYLSPGPSGRRRGNYSSELSGRSELPFGRRQTVQRAGGLPRRSSPGPTGPLTCRCRKIGAHDALPSRRRSCVFWESAAPSTATDIWSPCLRVSSPSACSRRCSDLRT